jgi:hypothetical protein
MWALPQGECGHAKGITDASPTIFKPKPRKGEEGGGDPTLPRGGEGGGGGGGLVGGDARPCVVGRRDRGLGMAGVCCVAVLKQGKNKREGTLTRVLGLV